MSDGNKLKFSATATISRQGGSVGFDGSKVLRGEGEAPAEASGTSIFDPVLAELMYRWFCPPGGLILDPFAGGSVRGIVAAKLGFRYVGIDLRPEQLAANRKQAKEICAGDAYQPEWIEGDSSCLATILGGREPFDFVFSCPPYGSLEVYSDDPRDLSAMTHEAFIPSYMSIIEQAAGALKPDRFAAFVVGDFRDKAGLYVGFPELTFAAFTKAGMKKYNEAILVTAVGSLPIRIGRQFDGGRKLGRTHQNVLSFVKGNSRRAAEACQAKNVVVGGEAP